MSKVNQNLILPAEEQGIDLIEEPDHRDEQWWKDREKEDRDFQIKHDTEVKDEH